MAFSSLAEIDSYMKENTCEFWEAVIREEARDSQQPEMDIVNRMTQMYRAMKEADERHIVVCPEKMVRGWQIMLQHTNACVVNLAGQSWQGQSRCGEQCLYEADRCSTDGRLLWCCACDINHI